MSTGINSDIENIKNILISQSNINIQVSAPESVYLKKANNGYQRLQRKIVFKIAT